MWSPPVFEYEDSCESSSSEESMVSSSKEEESESVDELSYSKSSEHSEVSSSEEELSYSDEAESEVESDVVEKSEEVSSNVDVKESHDSSSESEAESDVVEKSEEVSSNVDDSSSESKEENDILIPTVKRSNLLTSVRSSASSRRPIRKPTSNKNPANILASQRKDKVKAEPEEKPKPRFIPKGAVAMPGAMMIGNGFPALKKTGRKLD